MSFNIKNAQELEMWLRKKEYTMNEIKITAKEVNDKEYRTMEQCNRILGRNFHDTFNIWVKKWGRIPTPQEFVAMQLNDVKKNYQDDAWRRNWKINFEWNEAVEKGIKQRLQRSYISFINELHTEMLIKDLYPSITIIRSGELDFAGIDILAKDKKNNIDHLIHITKNSAYAIELLFKKGGQTLNFKYNNSLWSRPVWGKVRNHPIYSERSFSGHTFLLYDTFTSPSTRMVNGYPLFTRAYIQTKLDIKTELNRAV